MRYQNFQNTKLLQENPNIILFFDKLVPNFVQFDFHSLFAKVDLRSLLSLTDTPTLSLMAASPFPLGSVVELLYTLQLPPEYDGGLNGSVGDIFVVVGEGDEQWVLVAREGRKGYVPCHYINFVRVRMHLRIFLSELLFLGQVHKQSLHVHSAFLHAS